MHLLLPVECVCVRWRRVDTHIHTTVHAVLRCVSSPLHAQAIIVYLAKSWRRRAGLTVATIALQLAAWAYFVILARTVPHGAAKTAGGVVAVVVNVSFFFSPLAALRVSSDLHLRCAVASIRTLHLKDVGWCGVEVAGCSCSQDSFVCLCLSLRSLPPPTPSPPIPAPIAELTPFPLPSRLVGRPPGGTRTRPGSRLHSPSSCSPPAPTGPWRVHVYVLPALHHCQGSCVWVVDAPHGVVRRAQAVLGHAGKGGWSAWCAHSPVKGAVWRSHAAAVGVRVECGALEQLGRCDRFFLFHGLGYPFTRGCAVFSLQ
jgi:hypothetical protein